MFKQEVKELPFVIRYVLDQYKTQEMYDKAILENGGILESLPDCYKAMCNKAVDNHALKFVLDCCKTRKKCNKAANTSLL